MYLTKEDYLAMKGIDLQVELKGSFDDESNGVELFIANIEDFVLSYIEMNYEKPDGDYNADIMKRAVAAQIDYILLNGNVTIQKDFYGAKLAPNAFMILKNAGYANAFSQGPRGFKVWR